ncbi:MAG: TasA family protein [Actinomycetota bacterium]
MGVRPKLMAGAGIAVAGLGLIGAGAGATFTTQVSGDTSISSGGLGLSLNGETGSHIQVGVDGKNLGSHFAPISKDLLLKNTGTLDMASTFLSVTATGCGDRDGSRLTRTLHVKLSDVTNDNVIYEGSLCSLVDSVSGQGARSGNEQGFTTPRSHGDVGGQLPHRLSAGSSIHYLLVIGPSDREHGLPSEAQNSTTSVKLVFTGFDY